MGREFCLRCGKAGSHCVCPEIRSFHSPITFVILIHPNEARRAVATGRMAHLCVENSYLWKGLDFSQDERVNALLSDSSKYCVLLSPGLGSIDISGLKESEREALLPGGK